MPTPTRIVLVSAHRAWRAMLRAYLADQPGLVCVGEVERWLELQEVVAGAAPQVVLLEQGQWSAIALLGNVLDLRERQPQVKVIVVLEVAQRGFIDALRRAGVAGWLLKRDVLACLPTLLASLGVEPGSGEE